MYVVGGGGRVISHLAGVFRVTENCEDKSSGRPNLSIRVLVPVLRWASDPPETPSFVPAAVFAPVLFNSQRPSRPVLFRPVRFWRKATKELKKNLHKEAFSPLGCVNAFSFRPVRPDSGFFYLLLFYRSNTDCWVKINFFQFS